MFKSRKPGVRLKCKVKNRNLRSWTIRCEHLEARLLLAKAGGEFIEVPWDPQAIVDGVRAPYMPEVGVVAFLNPNGGFTSNGTGTLISRQHVLTAAHVVDSNNDFRWTSADRPLLFITTHGDDILQTRTTYKVTHVDMREDYTSGENDLAVLRLETFVPDIVPAQLGVNPGYVQPGNEVEIVGFGRTRGSGNSLAPNGSVRYHGGARVESASATKIHFRLDELNESIIAPGDSGGPTYYVRLSDDGRTVVERRLVGVHQGGNTDQVVATTATDMRVSHYASWIQGIIANDFFGPTATVHRNNAITEPASSDFHLRVEYRDVNRISPLGLQEPHIALVGPNNYYNQYPEIGLVIQSPDGATLTVDYRFRGPGGAWGSQHNGQYKVALLNRGLTDGVGNPVGSSVIATTQVSLPLDNIRPVASASISSQTIDSAGAPTFLTAVQYTDNFGVDFTSLGNDDVRLVKGSTVLTGRLAPGAPAQSSASLIVQYVFTPPGGSWDPSDNGVYQLVAQAGAVRDISGNTILGGVLGTVTVNANNSTRPRAQLNTTEITEEISQIEFSITYFDDVAINVASIQNDSNDVTVEQANGIGFGARLVSVSQTTNGSPITAVYRVSISASAAKNGQSFQVRVFDEVFDVPTITDTAGNTIASGYIGAFRINIGADRTRPQAFASVRNVNFEGGQGQAFNVLFSDDTAIEATSISSENFYVLGPNDVELPVYVSAANYGQNVPDIVSTLGLTAPGESWDHTDNGTYRLRSRGGGVRDGSGNFISDEDLDLGTFEVNIPEPEPLLTTTQIDSIARPIVSHTFTVTYSHSSGIDVSMLGNDDILVANGAGFSQFAEFVGLNLNSDGTPRTATYRITGPGGGWDVSDAGDYTLTAAENSVFALDGTPLALDALLGTLQARILSAPIPAQTSTGENQISEPIPILPVEQDEPWVTHFKITGITGGTVFLADGAAPVQNGAFITKAQGAEGLRVLPSGSGQATFQATASLSGNDSETGETAATFTVQVIAVDDPPVANPLTLTTLRNIPISFLLPGDDGDPESEQSLLYFFSRFPIFGFVQGHDQSLGSVTYFPPFGFIGGDSFSYYVQENGGRLSNIAEVQINVIAGSAPSVASPLPNISTTVNQPDRLIALDPVFSDVDIATAGDSLTYSVFSDLPGLVSGFIEGNQLRLAFGAGASGVANISVTAFDRTGASVSDVFTVTVAQTNSAPFVQDAIDDIAALQNSADRLHDLNGVFSDNDIVPRGDRLTYSVRSNSNPAAVVASIENNLLRLRPVAGALGTSTITVRATDQFGLFVEDTFSITLTATPPVTAVNDIYVLSGSEINAVGGSLGVLNNDVHPATGASVAILVAPRFGSVTIQQDGSFTYTRGAGFNGIDEFTCRLTAPGSSRNAVVKLLSHDASLVTKLYEQVLGRAPEEEGLLYWTAQVGAGIPLGNVASGIFESAERLDPIVAQMYRDYLFREADASGLAYWRGFWQADGGPEGVVSGIISSDEFFASSEVGLLNRNYVWEVYERLLGREADSEGLDYWTDLLNNLLLTRAEMIYGFELSSENFRNRVAGWYQQYLSRSAFDFEIDAYVDQLESGASQRDIQIQLINTAEYRNRPPQPTPGQIIPYTD